MTVPKRYSVTELARRAAAGDPDPMELIRFKGAWRGKTKAGNAVALWLGERKQDGRELYRFFPVAALVSIRSGIFALPRWLFDKENLHSYAVGQGNDGDTTG